MSPVVAALAVIAGSLANPSFEAVSLSPAWSLHVYGAKPTVLMDGTAPHGGKQSLCVRADEPSDTALGQEILLPANRWFRLDGWIRTRGLRSVTAPVLGTLQVQAPGGTRVLAGGRNHTGDTDWTRESILFRSPPDGRTRIALFFAGYGTGTGAAWFDDISIEEVSMGAAPIRVTRGPLVPATVSPMQSGQFIEYLCDLVGGMWAEKLYDNSFEGLSPYAFEHIRETDFREHPWHPCGATHRAEFARDGQTFVSGKASQRVAATQPTNAWLGMQQDGLSVDAAGHRLRIWLRAEALRGPVRVRLFDARGHLAQAEFTPGADWQRFSANLHPLRASRAASLAIEFRGPGTLWMDNAFLMPANSDGGWRPDVVSALRKLKPAVIRTGGSVVDWPAYGDYEWQKAVGDLDHRVPFRSWGGLQPMGAGLGEFVDLCRRVQAEPLICVRFNGSSPREAANQVEYFNGATTTPMGARRAADGHPEPYGVRLWQVGNEVRSDTYDNTVRAFAEAMKKADPSIRILTCEPTEGIVRNAGDVIDYVCPHHYGCDNLQGMAANIQAIREMLARLAPGRPIRIGVTEWNTTAGDRGPGRSTLWTLANALACSRYHNLMHRNCDIVEIANRSNLTNSFCSGILQTDRARLYVTPTYHAQCLYAEAAGGTPLRLVSEFPVDRWLDAGAVLSEDGKTVRLYVVNDGSDPETRQIETNDVLPIGPVTARTLSDTSGAKDPDAVNSFEHPGRVSVRTRELHAGNRIAYRFPAYSLTVLSWQVQ